ncbi:MAG: synthetase [Candidatus Saccharibacteria bacterium]|nr:synthetase [Candidatus Saccharibacteria bacterium]
METLSQLEFQPYESYLRVATACPEVNIADVATNTTRITELYKEATAQGVALVVFPELSLTGYSIGDLVQQQSLLKQARTGLQQLAEQTRGSETTMVVGLPLQVDNALYNCSAVLADGDIKGLVPKQNLPTYGEFYEKRWYQTWQQPNTAVRVGQQDVPFGTELLFDIGGAKIGVETCEDLWVAEAPSIQQAQHGALVIANLSASPELVGKAAYRRQLVAMQSAKLMAGYVYAGSDWTESTMDVVMGGHQLIAENGRLLAERKPFTKDERLRVADIDIDHLKHDRLRDTNFVNKVGWQVVKTVVGTPEFVPSPHINPHPFLPTWENETERAERLQSIIDIQAHGLAGRLQATKTPYVHLGLSGGLDSTLAFLVACRSAEIIGVPPKDLIRTYTMPGVASSDRTQNNAVKLAQLYNVPNQVVPIDQLAHQMHKAIGHDGQTQDVTYENVQARIRTEILFNKGNQLQGINLGTGDLSEIALGWCTFNADHMSHYHVNAGVPKTLVRHLVRHITDNQAGAEARDILLDILDTPVSPELTRAAKGEIDQKTEDIIGPYELHDFFLYYLIRWGDEPAKIRFLANQAFEGVYQPEEINKWLMVFYKRFAFSQFKRSSLPDGAKVGSVALSPRGDWRMPSDLYNTAIWE